MRLTSRDIRLLRDLTLSHVLSRDQVLALGYFSSVTRTNSRLRALREAGLVRALDTSFFGQSLYAVRPAANQVVGERLAGLAASRAGSPRFLQHALSVTNVRIAMLEKGADAWKFELQSRTSFTYREREWEVRPDGLAVHGGRLFAVEADLGHVAPSKFAAKLAAYDAFSRSGECSRSWGFQTFSVLTVTTGPLRAARLARLVSDASSFEFLCHPHDRLGIRYPETWS